MPLGVDDGMSCGVLSRLRLPHAPNQSTGTQTCMVPWLSFRRGHFLRSASLSAEVLSVPRISASSA